MSKCHASSTRCDEHQQVHIGGAAYTATVHNIYSVCGYSPLFGFVKAKEPDRRVSVRLVPGSDAWYEYERSGLDREHWIGVSGAK